MSNHLTFLGTASGRPQPDRSGSGHIIQIGESLTLLDCGSGTASTFARFGFDPFKLDRIIISHTHADHMSELPVFIQWLHGLSVHRPLDVYVPEDFVQVLATLLPGLYLFEERNRVDLRVHGYSEGFELTDPFKLTALRNSHTTKVKTDFLDSKYPNRFESFSFLVETDQKRIFHSADANSFEEIEPYLKDLDYAILETTHFDIGQIFEFARQSTVQQYILTHISGPDTLEFILTQIKETGLKNVTVARDGLRIDL